MRFGLVLPNLGPYAAPYVMLRAARLAVRLGFSSLWVSDHLLVRRSQAGSLGRVFEPEPAQPPAVPSQLTGSPREMWEILGVLQAAGVSTVVVGPLAGPERLEERLMHFREKVAADFWE